MADDSTHPEALTVAQVTHRRDELDARNLQRINALAARGIQLGGLQMVRIVSYLEYLLDEELPWAQLHYAEQVSEALDEAERNANRARLLAPPKGQ